MVLWAGSSESFHYFVMHWRGKPLLSGLSWFFCFFMYYGVLLCSAGIFQVLAGIPFPWIDYPTYTINLLHTGDSVRRTCVPPALSKPTMWPCHVVILAWTDCWS